MEEIKTDTDRGLTKSPTAGFVRKGCSTDETSRRGRGLRDHRNKNLDCDTGAAETTNGDRLRLSLCASLRAAPPERVDRSYSPGVT